jgi:fatty acid desaturase
MPTADPRLRGVEWKDLRELSRAEVAHELLISAPWLAGSLTAAAWDHHLPALACSFMFFLTGLRQAHNAQHYALGLPRLATDGVMLLLSVAMLGSMHAVQTNHLRHHRFCLEDQDVEGASARLSAWRAIVVGPLFPIRLHREALAVSSARQRRWIHAELAVNGLWIIAVLLLLDVAWLRYHVAAMAVGQCLSAFFAVWTVHHGCEAARGPIARTIRGGVKAVLSYDMFFHVEHHLYPAVPTRRLPILARRLDAVAPELAARRVF